MKLYYDASGVRDPGKPVFTLHRPQTLANAPMTRHLGEGKSIFLEVHDPQVRRAIHKNQNRLFTAGFGIVRVVVKLAARSAGINNFAVRRKYLRLERLRSEFGHGKSDHKRCTALAVRNRNITGKFHCVNHPLLLLDISGFRLHQKKLIVLPPIADVES